MISRMIAYFGSLGRSLLECVAVADHTVFRYEVTATDGKMRLCAWLRDGGQLELYEYVALDAQAQISRLKYSYHWQGADGHLLRRWEAVNHFLHLPHARYHVHLPDGQVQSVDPAHSITAVLAEIQTNLRMETTTNV